MRGTGRRSLRTVTQGAAGQPLQLLLEEGGRSQGRRHQEEARPGEGEQGDLPGVAALRVGIVVELVHDHRPEVAPLAPGEGDVGEDLRGAAEHGGLGVDARIPGHHADRLRAEIPAEREELLVHEGLDGAGVDRALARAQRLEMECGGDQRFPGAGRRVEDHVVRPRRARGSPPPARDRAAGPGPP